MTKSIQLYRKRFNPCKKVNNPNIQNKILFIIKSIHLYRIRFYSRQGVSKYTEQNVLRQRVSSFTE